MLAAKEEFELLINSHSTICQAYVQTVPAIGCSNAVNCENGSIQFIQRSEDI